MSSNSSMLSHGPAAAGGQQQRRTHVQHRVTCPRARKRRGLVLLLLTQAGGFKPRPALALLNRGRGKWRKAAATAAAAAAFGHAQQRDMRGGAGPTARLCWRWMYASDGGRAPSPTPTIIIDKGYCDASSSALRLPGTSVTCPPSAVQRSRPTPPPGGPAASASGAALGPGTASWPAHPRVGVCVGV